MSSEKDTDKPLKSKQCYTCGTPLRYGHECDNCKKHRYIRLSLRPLMHQLQREARAEIRAIKLERQLAGIKWGV